MDIAMDIAIDDLVEVLPEEISQATQVMRIGMDI